MLSKSGSEASDLAACQFNPGEMAAMIEEEDLVSYDSKDSKADQVLLNAEREV